MSDLDQTTEDLPKITELDALKARADFLGISYHPSIGLDKLKAKVDAKLNDQPDPDAAVTLDKTSFGETEEEMRSRIRENALKMVRVNITCMNPAKREWHGEIFTIGNDLIGTYKKFVPFNTTEGYHIPNIMFEYIKERECQVFVTERSQNGVSVRTGKQIKEFAIDVLPPLTKEELAELARRQAMAGAVV